MQDYSNIVKQTYTNNNTEQVTIALQELAISIFKILSMIHNLTFYKKVISNLIYGWQWKDAIEEKLYNLESHYIWEFKKLL